MPYAKIAAARLKIVDNEMLNLETEKERKQYYITKEKELRNEFEKDMVKLTFSQGLLLMKLIDRETGKTTYSILKEYRSTLNAVFWQSFAKIFGYNLKQSYNPEKDNDIEMVIKMLGYD
jgi:nucleoside diphosphate kinase